MNVYLPVSFPEIFLRQSLKHSFKCTLLKPISLPKAMATSVAHDFPLSTSDPSEGRFETAPGVGSGTEGGASGTSSGLVISTGGLIAIIVVVIFVTILGRELPSAVTSSSIC